jgi:hypothetical protein
MRRLDCHARIKQVKSNCDAAQQTVKVFMRIGQQQPEVLYRHNLSIAQMQVLVEELHDIYCVRMFARFESDLRHYWRTKIRDTRPKTEDLLSAIAGRFGVPQDTLDIVHEIRIFRNYLIHEDFDLRKSFTVDEASGHLNVYLARLPLQW